MDKMKVGILTQPLVNNYGGILQNFALQTVLNKQGHEAITINFVHKPLEMSMDHLIKSVLKRIFRRVTGKKQKYINPYKEDRAIFTVQPEQQRFINTYISKIDVSDKLTTNNNIVDKFDAFVVGSDQIWRPLYSPNITNYFLDFAHHDQCKVAYAASFGTDLWEFSDQLTEKAANLLKTFDSISVREESGVRLCKDYLNCEAIHVLDPTFLLNPEDYIELLSLGENSEKAFISTYILDDSKSKQSAIDFLIRSEHLSVKKLGKESNGRLQSIESWLNDIRNAEMIVTDSFHGTVFSILFHKQFITFYNPVRGNSRMISLLKSLGLEKRLVAPDDIEQICANEIDWDYVDRQLKQLRHDSLTFLFNSFNGR